MFNKIISHSKPTLGKEEEQAVIEVIRSGQITQNSKVVEFENLIANYIKRKYAIAVNSGISALHLSLISLGISEGDIVILPSYTCDALLQAVWYVKAKPIIVDVYYKDGNISLDCVRKILNLKVKCIVIPHNFGFPAKIDKFLEFGIPIIEDCAVAIGGIYKDKKLGSFGKISVYSFYATKMITTGEGGMILTDDKKIANKVKDLRNYAKHSIFKVRYNYKMTDIEAALGICQFKKLQFFISKRKVLYEKYTELLKGRKDLLLPLYRYDDKTLPTFYRYIIKIFGYDIKKITTKMKEKGIICGSGVLQPLHRLMMLEENKYPNSERINKEALSLPLYPSLNIVDLEYIVWNFLKILEELK